MSNCHFRVTDNLFVQHVTGLNTIQDLTLQVFAWSWDEGDGFVEVGVERLTFRFNLLQQAGRQEEAMASLEEYNKEYSSPYVLSTLGDFQMSMYNDSTALAYYDEALDIAPDFSPALLGKAET